MHIICLILEVIVQQWIIIIIRYNIKETIELP